MCVNRPGGYPSRAAQLASLLLLGPRGKRRGRGNAGCTRNMGEQYQAMETEARAVSGWIALLCVLALLAFGGFFVSASLTPRAPAAMGVGLGLLATGLFCLRGVFHAPTQRGRRHGVPRHLRRDRAQQRLPLGQPPLRAAARVAARPEPHHARPSRSTTAAAIRSRSARWWCGACRTLRGLPSRSRTSPNTCGCSASRRCAKWPAATPMITPTRPCWAGACAPCAAMPSGSPKPCAWRSRATWRWPASRSMKRASRIWPTRPRSPRSCCGGSRPRPCSPRAASWWKVRSAWWRWRSSTSTRRASPPSRPLRKLRW